MGKRKLKQEKIKKVCELCGGGDEEIKGYSVDEPNSKEKINLCEVCYLSYAYYE